MPIITRNEQILLLSIWLLSLIVSVGGLVWAGTSILQQELLHQEAIKQMEKDERE